MIRTADAIDRLAPVTLAELEATAALLTRVDRKYLLAPSRLEDLLDRVEASTGSRVPTRALEIDEDYVADFTSGRPAQARLLFNDRRSRSRAMAGRVRRLVEPTEAQQQVAATVGSNGSSFSPLRVF